MLNLFVCTALQNDSNVVCILSSFLWLFDETFQIVNLKGEERVELSRNN